jgi:hypothetical protein
VSLMNNQHILMSLCMQLFCYTIPERLFILLGSLVEELMLIKVFVLCTLFTYTVCNGRFIYEW